MNQYVNIFSCAKDNSNTEVVLKAGQTYPTFDEIGRVQGTAKEEVFSMTMTVNSARALVASLSELLDRIEIESQTNK